MGTDVALMQDFNEFLDNCVKTVNVNVDVIEVERILNLDYSDIISLNSEEAAGYSFRLKTYAIFVHGDLDKNTAKILWCEEMINRIIGKQYAEYDKYMKHEVKRQLIISQDGAAGKIESLRIRLVSVNTLLRDKLKIILSLAEDFSQIARRKSYGH